MRFREHMTHFKCRRIEKSSFVRHAFESKLRIDIENLKLIKKCNKGQLDAYESL